MFRFWFKFKGFTGTFAKHFLVVFPTVGRDFFGGSYLEFPRLYLGSRIIGENNLENMIMTSKGSHDEKTKRSISLKLFFHLSSFTFSLNNLDFLWEFMG